MLTWQGVLDKSSAETIAVAIADAYWLHLLLEICILLMKCWERPIAILQTLVPVFLSCLWCYRLGGGSGSSGNRLLLSNRMTGNCNCQVAQACSAARPEARRNKLW